LLWEDIVGLFIVRGTKKTGAADTAKIMSAKTTA
jgi:hypothetical protein